MQAVHSICHKLFIEDYALKASALAIGAIAQLVLTGWQESGRPFEKFLDKVFCFNDKPLQSQLQKIKIVFILLIAYQVLLNFSILSAGISLLCLVFGHKMGTAIGSTLGHYIFLRRIDDFCNDQLLLHVENLPFNSVQKLVRNADLNDDWKKLAKGIKNNSNLNQTEKASLTQELTNKIINSNKSCYTSDSPTYNSYQNKVIWLTEIANECLSEADMHTIFSEILTTPLLRIPAAFKIVNSNNLDSKKIITYKFINQYIEDWHTISSNQIRNDVGRSLCDVIAKSTLSSGDKFVLFMNFKKRATSVGLLESALFHAKASLSEDYFVSFISQIDSTIALTWAIDNIREEKLFIKIYESHHCTSYTLYSFTSMKHLNGYSYLAEEKTLLHIATEKNWKTLAKALLSLEKLDYANTYYTRYTIKHAVSYTPFASTYKDLLCRCAKPEYKIDMSNISNEETMQESLVERTSTKDYAEFQKRPEILAMLEEK